MLLRTEETLFLKLFTLSHEATHLFHVMGEDFYCRYDGILGQDFWKDKKATVDCCNREITVGVGFDDETPDLNRSLTLRARTERVVRLPTKSKDLG